MYDDILRMDLEVLEHTGARWDDGANEMVMVCNMCSERLCGIEDGDSLGVLARVAASHNRDTGCVPL